MAGKLVATDVKATPSSKKHPGDGNQTGKWNNMGPPMKQPTALLKTEKGKALFSAKAFYLYIGGSNGAPPVPLPPVPSSVELKAQTTLLTEKGKPLLLKGDKKEDSFGNKLEVSVTSGKLKTG